MLNAILHKGLGATDPYQQHIFTDNNGIEYLLLSDGKNSWKIVGVATSRSGNKLAKPVADTLHEWLLKHYRHGLVDGSEPGYNATEGAFLIPIDSPSSRGSRSSSSGSYSANQSNGDIIYLRSGYYKKVPDTNKTTAYTTALLNGKVITLSQVLKSVNPSTHVFYVPVGYYYQGDMSEVPSVSSKDADDAGARAGYNNNNFVSPPTQPTSPKSVKSDNTMMYLMLPLLAILAVNMLNGDNKRKKR